MQTETTFSFSWLADCGGSALALSWAGSVPTVQGSLCRTGINSAVTNSDCQLDWIDNSGSIFLTLSVRVFLERTEEGSEGLVWMTPSHELEFQSEKIREKEKTSQGLTFYFFCFLIPLPLWTDAGPTPMPYPLECTESPVPWISVSLWFVTWLLIKCLVMTMRKTRYWRCW